MSRFLKSVLDNEKQVLLNTGEIKIVILKSEPRILISPAVGIKSRNRSPKKRPRVHFHSFEVMKDGNWHKMTSISKTNSTSDCLMLSCRMEGLGSVESRLTLLSETAFHLSINYASLNPQQVKVSGKCYDDEHFYGFGERFNALDQRGNVLEMWNKDIYHGKGKDGYKTIPFFMSTAGYGFHLDSTSHSFFDMASSNPKLFSITDTNSVLSFNFFYGPELTRILEQYTCVTGRPPILPKWAFAPWKSRDEHLNTEAVFEDVEKMRALDIPLSIQVIDSPWEAAYNDFEFNLWQFPDPRRLVDHIHKLGCKLMLWIAPFISKESKTGEMFGKIQGQKPTVYFFDELAEKGYFIKTPEGKAYLQKWWKGTGCLIDFTNPDAYKWWKEQIRKLARFGVDAIKTDDGEHVPEDAVFYNGKTGVQMHNYYSYLYNKATFEALVEIKKEAVLWSRSGCSGSQKFPMHFPADKDPTWDFVNGLPVDIIAVQAAGMSGLALEGTDIGPYNQPAKKELFIRWAEFGAFLPAMQIHVKDPITGPWDYDEETVQVYRTYAKLHTSLFPYIYTYAKVANRTGLPIIRALALMHQDDPNAHANTMEYFFGEEILVAPIYQPENERDIYLPEGEWVDYWSGKIYRGKKTIRYKAPLNVIPLFIKNGSIIPRIDNSVSTLVEDEDIEDSNIRRLTDNIILDIYPKGFSRFQMYDESEFTVLSDLKSVEISISSVPRSYQINVHGGKPKLVLRNETQISDNVVKAPSWHFDEVNNACVIEFWHGGTKEGITLRY